MTALVNKLNLKGLTLVKLFNQQFLNLLKQNKQIIKLILDTNMIKQHQTCLEIVKFNLYANKSIYFHNYLSNN